MVGQVQTKVERVEQLDADLGAQLESFYATLEQK